ncbi:RsmB/NOP family class I SAM-dependent RNA methyltransferase [Nanchangia anserum]|uniref:RsmB/NOP family class I SAM-dependent RNA methyltransferase n=1 Tax=Nanchangia anserum TaxID=2692125 RepID=UPI001D1000D3|nr:transcription antitermination factor NusB [Nanchangia anserum]
MRGDDARTIAAEVLLACEVDGAYANLALPARLSRSSLSARDRAFATKLTYEAQRLAGYYDWIAQQCLNRRLGDVDPEVRVLLRIGAHQLLAMRVPAHAAVSATIDAGRALTHRGALGLVNAVLRRIAREADRWEDRVNAIDDPWQRRAVRTSHPRDVVRALDSALRAHGRAGEIDALLDANNAAPWVQLVARPGLVTPDELADEAEDVLDVSVAYGQLSPWSLTLSGGDPARLPSVSSGAAAIEDEGSQLVAGILASAPVDGEESAWLDLCAGPGGKTALLRALAPAGVRLVANEVTAHRARLVEDSTRAFGDVEVHTGDGRTFGDAAVYDRVLVDAPCTGLGSLRRRPEARFRGRVAQVPELANLQVGLLTRALDLTRPGGIVGYATCSPHVGETLKVIERVMADSARRIEPVDAVAIARKLAPHEADFGQGPYVQLWPHRHGTDAMFLALLRVS